jgi:hypothetical protein
MSFAMFVTWVLVPSPFKEETVNFVVAIGEAR